jgi:hypothetical protein
MEFTVSLQSKQETDHQILIAPIENCGSMAVETSKSIFANCLTIQWQWDLNSKDCPVYRDSKFIVPSNNLMTYSVMRLAECEELKT